MKTFPPTMNAAPEFCEPMKRPRVVTLELFRVASATMAMYKDATGNRYHVTLRYGGVILGPRGVHFASPELSEVCNAAG